jgi:hypothetical protein
MISLAVAPTIKKSKLSFSATFLTSKSVLINDDSIPTFAIINNKSRNRNNFSDL